ncbi:hypothetical protein SBADM41S_06942 [Streptomyces badius]
MTEVAQPLLVASGVALARQLRTWGVEPEAVAGHSAGEIAAACVSGVLTLRDAVRFAAERGRLMGAFTGPGAMLAVRGGEEAVAAAVAESGGNLTVAAYNGPGLQVLSGTVAAVEHAALTLEAQGVPTRRLRVSRAFHSPLMRPVAGPRSPTRPVRCAREPREQDRGRCPPETTQASAPAPPPCFGGCSPRRCGCLPPRFRTTSRSSLSASTHSPPSTSSGSSNGNWAGLFPPPSSSSTGPSPNWPRTSTAHPSSPPPSPVRRPRPGRVPLPAHPRPTGPAHQQPAPPGRPGPRLHPPDRPRPPGHPAPGPGARRARRPPHHAADPHRRLRGRRWRDRFRVTGAVRRTARRSVHLVRGPRAARSYRGTRNGPVQPAVRSLRRASRSRGPGAGEPRAVPPGAGDPPRGR